MPKRERTGPPPTGLRASLRDERARLNSPRTEPAASPNPLPADPSSLNQLKNLKVAELKALCERHELHFEAGAMKPHLVDLLKEHYNFEEARCHSPLPQPASHSPPRG